MYDPLIYLWVRNKCLPLPGSLNLFFTLYMFSLIPSYHIKKQVNQSGVSTKNNKNITPFKALHAAAVIISCYIWQSIHNVVSRPLSGYRGSYSCGPLTVTVILVAHISSLTLVSAHYSYHSWSHIYLRLHFCCTVPCPCTLAGDATETAWKVIVI